jgi:adenylate kinase family enzyme
VKRILVLGSAGAGKSTFARQLGERLGLETIHLDSHYWQPNWTGTPPEEWERRVKELAQRPAWVMDGNYRSSLPLRLPYADTVIFLDRSRARCLLRCFGRLLKHRGRNRPELPLGCNEKIDREFFQWIWNYPRDVRPGIIETLGTLTDKEVVILRMDREIDEFLARQCDHSSS